MSLTTNKDEKTAEKIAVSTNENYYLINDENGIKKMNGNNILPFFEIKKNKNKVFHSFFSGSTGSGKSYLARKLIEQIKPALVFVFSSVDDGDFDNIPNVKSVKVDLIKIMDENKLDINGIYDLIPNGSICIFDDILSFGLKLSKPYIELRLMLLQKGRHKQVSCFVIEQMALGGNSKGSREVLLNCQYFFCFPRSNFNSFEKLSKIYLGLTKQQIAYLRKLDSRYVMINKAYPSYYISSKEVGILN